MSQQGQRKGLCHARGPLRGVALSSVKYAANVIEQQPLQKDNMIENTT